MEKEFLTVDEVCKWLKVCRKTTERWRKKGLPYIKEGGLIRFDKQSVIEWLKSKEKN